MRKLFFAATCAPALALAAPASAKSLNCDDGWTALNDQYNEIAREGTISGSMQTNLQDMKRVAAALHAAGYQDACEGIVEAMKDMADNQDSRDRYETASMDSDAMNRRKAAETTEAADNADAEEMDEQPEWKADLARAEKVSALTEISMEELADLDVHSSVNGYDIGDVSQLLMAKDGGEPKYFVLSHGGFLGIGDTEFVLPLDMAKVSEESETMYVDLTDDALERAPEFDAARYEEDGEVYLRKVSDTWED